ncbi:MAG TPA: hypothetical protein VFT19_01775 [Solirubrobacterales bacterium]|nr:hypothetical protein [Solirubrobacterales bacterium]
MSPSDAEASGAGADPPEVARGSLAVGDYVLNVDGTAGTVIQRRAGAAGEGAESLERALDEQEPEGDSGAAVAAGVVDDASEVTAKVERAVALGKAVAEGKALNPEQLALEAGSLLDLLGRLDRQERFKEALRLARALVNLLMLLRRWAALLRALRAALRAAEKLGDLAAVGWAKHELGTLRLAAGGVKGAELSLREAQEIRERIGDRRGLAATARNLQVLCERLREMLREEELVRAGAQGPSALRPLILAALFVLVFGGGVAAGVIAGNSSDADDSARITDGNGNRNQPTNENGVGSNGPGGGDESFILKVTVDGEGTVAVEGGGTVCPPGLCQVSLPEGEKVILEAQEGRGSVFKGFSSVDCTGTEPCRLTMNEDKTVTASFVPAEEKEPPEGEGAEEGIEAPSTSPETVE